MLIIISVGITIVWANDPGMETDPLISKSYIDQVLLPQIYSYIDKAVQGVSGTGQSNSKENSTFEVVSLKAGQKLEAKKGCEMILRMGSGTIVASSRGGIADVTGGIDLAQGSQIPSNHLLIVPLDDGRGIIASTDMLIMVRGSYDIIE